MKTLYRCNFCKNVEFADFNIVKKHVNRCKNVVANRHKFANKNYLEKATTCKSADKNLSGNNTTFGELINFSKCY